MDQNEYDKLHTAAKKWFSNTDWDASPLGLYDLSRDIVRYDGLGVGVGAMCRAIIYSAMSLAVAKTPAEYEKAMTDLSHKVPDMGIKTKLPKSNIQLKDAGTFKMTDNWEGKAYILDRGFFVLFEVPAQHGPQFQKDVLESLRTMLIKSQDVSKQALDAIMKVSMMVAPLEASSHDCSVCTGYGKCTGIKYGIADEIREADLAGEKVLLEGIEYLEKFNVRYDHEKNGHTIGLLVKNLLGGLLDQFKEISGSELTLDDPAIKYSILATTTQLIVAAFEIPYEEVKEVVDSIKTIDDRGYHACMTTLFAGLRAKGFSDEKISEILAESASKGLAKSILPSIESVDTKGEDEVSSDKKKGFKKHPEHEPGGIQFSRD